MQGRSLGLIETSGYTAAVEAVDVACKTARVLFEGYDLVGRGLVTVKFSGDVAAVRAAVTAGAAAAQKVGLVVSVHVIARPHEQLGAAGPGSPGSPPEKGPEPDLAKKKRVPPARAKRAPDRESSRTKRPKTVKKAGRKPKKKAP